MKKLIKNTNIYLLIIYFILITWLTFQVININKGLQINGNSPLTYFWEIQFSGPSSSLIIDTISMIIFSVYGSTIYIYIKNNNFFYSVQQRIGYTKFVKYAVVKTFFYATLLSLLTKVYELLLICLVIKKIPSNIALSQELLLGRNPLDDNTIKGYFIFLLLSSIGWGIYSIFILSIGLFVKKMGIYFVLSPIIGTTLILIPGILVPALGVSWVPFFSTWFIPSLIAPGQLGFAVSNGHSPNIYILFIFSTLIYSTLSFLVMKIWIYNKTKKG